MASKKKHMDEFLKEAFTRYVAIKDADYKRAQAVFSGVFELVKRKMCEQDNFFCKYSSQVLNAGSVYDGIKVGKLDEFDMDIVIRLPISYEDNANGIQIENHQPGFIKMKITNAFDNMDKQPDWEKCHVVTREWRDRDKYFLQSRFRQWMHGVVQRAVSDLGERISVDGVTYLLTFRESGPAFTLNIRNDGGEAFALDVDLVPVIRFMLPRWPEGYRKIPGSPVKEWLVVPKPLKSTSDATTRARCWRLAFHDFERDLIKGCELLKLTIRLVKKLRDTMEMKAIASYYIKTLFLWEIDERGKKYWQNKISVLFLNMVEKLYQALEAEKIPYYWHKKHNLLSGARPGVLEVYRIKLRSFIQRLRAGDVDGVMAGLLPAAEWEQFQRSEFYTAFPVPNTPTIELPMKVREASPVTGKSCDKDNISGILKELLATNKKILTNFESLTNMMSRIDSKVDLLSDRVDDLSETMNMVKIKMKQIKEKEKLVEENKKMGDDNVTMGEILFNIF